MAFCEMYRDGFCRWQKAGLKEAPQCAVEIPGGSSNRAVKEGEESFIPFKCRAYSAMHSKEQIMEGQAPYQEKVRVLLTAVPQPVA